LISSASGSLTRSSASTINTQGCAACGIAQFLKLPELMYSRSMIRHPSTRRTISSVPSVDPESATSTSSATWRADAMQAAMFLRSFLQGMMTVSFSFMFSPLSARGVQTSTQPARRKRL
jgi:hypothetical protein